MSKILIDVDGVTADLVTAVYEAIDSDKDPKSLRQWDFLELLSKEQESHARELMNSPDFWSGLPVIDGAKRAIKHLKDFGHQIVWVTSPWESCLGWETARRNWIRNNFGDDDIVITRDKGHIQGDVFIDDKPQNVEEWKKANPQGKALLFDAPHNREVYHLSTFSWRDVGDLT